MLVASREVIDARTARPVAASSVDSRHRIATQRHDTVERVGRRRQLRRSRRSGNVAQGPIGASVDAIESLLARTAASACVASGRGGAARGLLDRIGSRSGDAGGLRALLLAGKAFDKHGRRTLECEGGDDAELCVRVD